MQQTLKPHTQVKDFSYLLQKLVTKYDPLQVYCFHKHQEARTVEGCFGGQINNSYCDYWLLMVTESIARIENSVQDFANAHYETGKVLLLVHGKEGIDKSISEGNRFFALVFSTGKLLYNRKFTSSMMTASYWASIAYNERRKQKFDHGISRAEGFLHGAIECLGNRKYNVCVFMLHQAVEQCCIALIDLYMGYRCDIHNLHRLLMLCRCFSDRPYQLFISDQGDDKDLQTDHQAIFDKLVKSYSNARYLTDFKIEESEVSLLIDKVSALIRFSMKPEC